MSTDETQEVRSPANWYVIGGIAGSVLLLLLLGLLLLGRSPAGTVQTAPAGGPQESSLETARQMLLKASDTVTCRAALNQINTHFSQVPDSRPPLLEKDRAAVLREQLGLQADEVDEIAGSNFTRLDSHYLEHCCLLRDAARWLDDRGPGGKVNPPGLEQAAAAFDWVVRQVRTVGPGPSWVAPVMVLRRGWGTDLDRALIFLALLEQVGSPDGRQQHLHGCLLFLPNRGQNRSRERLWACGVAVDGGRDLYLFDPRLGMALPGPGGKGIATLAQARTDPGVLDQLDADKDHRYDVAAEQARTAEVFFVCALSGLAPRMKHLQDTLLPPAVEVRLAPDVAASLARLKAAAGDGGDREPAVKVWPEGVGLLRRFLSVEEGGADKPARYALKNLPGFALEDDFAQAWFTRQQRFMYESVPWEYFPLPFRNQRWDVGLGFRLRQQFLTPFVQGNLEGGRQRDLLLRGLPARAAPDLVTERNNWERQRKLLAADGNVEERVKEWMPKALAAHADQLRARDPQAQANAARAINDVWSQAEAVNVLLQGSVAVPRLAEIVYQLGLCKQEQAERLQARLDLAAGKDPGATSSADVEKAQATWRDALLWWKEFADQYPHHPAQAAARRLRGRAQAALGDWKGAIASWKDDLSGNMTELEKLASLYRARRLAAQHEQ
jgi:hypothetical protein